MSWTIACRWRVMVFVVIATLWPGILLNAQPKLEFTVEKEVHTYSVWHYFPYWNAGLLFGFYNNDSHGPVIYTVDRNNRKDEFLFLVPGAVFIRIFNIASGSDREFAVTAGVYDSNGEYTRLVTRLSPDRQRQTVIRPWPYCPAVAAIAADGSTWTIGRLFNDENTKVLARAVLRRYDAEGMLVGSANIKTPPYRMSLETSFLFSSRDRVGWLNQSGEYIEFSLDGEEIGRYEGPEGSQSGDISGGAISEDNLVIVGSFEGGKGGFVALDRSSRSWIPVSLPKKQTPRWARVLGFDGTTLVTTTLNGKLVRFNTK